MSVAIRALLTALVASATLSGCTFSGADSAALPFVPGSGSHDLHVTVELASAGSLVPNSEVKYNDVTVGTIRSIDFDHWHARLSLGLQRSAHIPSDVRATVGQKSLLGAEYLELAPPAAAGPAATELADNAELGLDRTGHYPETDELLSAAAMLLDNGGLSSVHTIVHELNAALSGHTGDVRSLVHDVSTLTAALNVQKGSILDTLAQLDRFAASINAHAAQVDTALARLPQALQVLSDQRARLMKALTAVNNLSSVGHGVIASAQADLAANLANLRPVTKQLADHASALAHVTEMATYPFPIRAINKAFYGDYINLFAEFKLDLGEMSKFWGGGGNLAALLAPLNAPAPTATQATNPLAVPNGSGASGLSGAGKVLDGLIGSVLPPSSPGGQGSSQPGLLSTLLGGGQ